MQTEKGASIMQRGIIRVSILAVACLGASILAFSLYTRHHAPPPRHFFPVDVEELVPTSQATPETGTSVHFNQPGHEIRIRSKNRIVQVSVEESNIPKRGALFLSVFINPTSPPPTATCTRMTSTRLRARSTSPTTGSRGWAPSIPRFTTSPRLWKGNESVGTAQEMVNRLV